MIGDPGGYSGPFRMSWCQTLIENDPDHRFKLITDAQMAVDWYRRLIATGYHGKSIEELRGKNLACFCKIGEPCHADVLLEIAN